MPRDDFISVGKIPQHRTACVAKEIHISPLCDLAEIYAGRRLAQAYAFLIEQYHQSGWAVLFLRQPGFDPVPGVTREFCRTTGSDDDHVRLCGCCSRLPTQVRMGK